MTRFLLVLLLVFVVGRAAWRLIGGIVEGASVTREGPPVRGTTMVRDPVCGTWVVPARALRLGEGDRIRYFCSERCLSQFRTRS